MSLFTNYENDVCEFFNKINTLKISNKHFDSTLIIFSGFFDIFLTL